MQSGDVFVDYYELLGVGFDVPASEVRVAFMRLAKQQHPDMGGSLEHMQLLNKAYATLKDPLTRRAYDRMHSFQTGTSTVRYRGDDSGDGGPDLDMTDDEMDDFIDAIFAEYTAKPPKQPLHKKATSVMRFRKKM